MKENFIQDLEFQIDQKDCDAAFYSKQKNYIKYIKSDEIKFKAITYKNEYYKKENYSLGTDKLYPLDLSQYFFDYFEYNIRDDKKEFVYYETPERAKFWQKLCDFYFSKFNYFKFCGPISGGKSTTLLKFKNEYKGVIYFNLKTIKKYYLCGNPIYKSIMSYEMKNIKLNEEKETNEKKRIR